MSELTDVHRQVEVCTKCDLWKSRTHAVPGAGDPEARVTFVGEAPGFHEDRQGLPFVGAAGHLLDQLLASIGLDRSEVFITNVVKCRPPANREPLPGEIDTCYPYLARQLELISPQVVVTLGRYSMARLLGPNLSISRIHGQPQKVGSRIILPLFHPAAALRQERYRAALEQDFQLLPQILEGGLTPAAGKADWPASPTQLNLL